jgi:hypothetical protein
LDLISVKIPIIGNIVFLDDIFFYTQVDPKGSICTLGDVVVGVTEAQIIIDEKAGKF